jgi:hypothetical protein
VSSSSNDQKFNLQAQLSEGLTSDSSSSSKKVLWLLINCKIKVFLFSPMYQVTSRGCSRAYLICALWRGLEHVRQAYSKGLIISFPFNDSDINGWLIEARNDCCDLNFQMALGGVDYFPEDPSTFWTLSSQFNTWCVCITLSVLYW